MFKRSWIPGAGQASGTSCVLLAGILAGFLPFGAAHAAAQCGGNFERWKAGVLNEARAAGIGERGLAVISRARRDPTVIRMDRSQDTFTQSFLEFAGRTASASRLQIGRAKLGQHASLFNRVERQYGVPGPVIVAFWGMETDYGVNQGAFDVVNALATLAHDCRRPHLFRPQLINVARIVEVGHLPESQLKGAWAGELGQVQILPSDYVRYGVDMDGDGRVNLKQSVPDVIATAANVMRHLGWRPGEPWLEEVRVPPDMPWQEADLGITHARADWANWGVRRANRGALPADGLQASLLLPMGRNGPAFLAYPNFRIFLEWNESLVYTTAAAYFATRLAGAPPMRRGSGIEVLSVNEVMQLQKRLQQRGHNVGGVDGIIGAGTRAAVKAEQLRLGLPADSWPTRELMSRLR